MFRTDYKYAKCPRTFGKYCMYAVRAKDLPHASKLVCAQRPIKRVKFEKYA